MKKIVLILLLFAVGNFKNYAQKHELGAVTIDELKEKMHPKDTSAVAAILFSVGKTYFEYNQNDGFVKVTEAEFKIKIYKKEGYEWANKEIAYYSGSNSNEKVDFSKALVYNLVNGQIEKTKLKSDGQFIEKFDKDFSIKKIALPNVKEGSIIEYKYSIRSPYITLLPEWKFQYKIPVNYSQFETYIPEYYVYNPHVKGSVPIVETKNSKSKTITLVNKEKSMASIRGGSLSGISRDVEEIQYLENQIKYVAENVPGIKEEAFVNNIDNYTSSIQFELSSKQLPQSTYEFFASTWEDVAKKIYEDEDFGAQLGKTNYYESDVTTLLQGLTLPEEKVATLFNYVQSKVAWNKGFGYLCDQGVKKAFENKTGNAAEINLMLTSMLRFAGFDANPVLVSTRANGISLFPSRTAFNMVIASVLIDGKTTLLDATSKWALPNVLPIRDLNWFGRMIRKDETSEMIDLMPATFSIDGTNMIGTLDNKGQFMGQVREQYSDYEALRYRENYGSLSNEAMMDKKEKEYKGVEIQDYEMTNATNLSEPVVEKYTIKISNSADVVGDKIFFSPLMHFPITENPFKQEVREYPIDFSFPFKEKYIINLNLPEGFQIETLPKNVALKMDKNYGGFTYTISSAGSQIQVIVTLDIAASIVPSDDYDTLKDFFKMVINKENEKIVLKKV